MVQLCTVLYNCIFMVFCSSNVKKASFHIQTQSLRVHVLNILLEAVKRCYCIYLMVNSELIHRPPRFIFSEVHESFQHLVMFEMFSYVGCVSPEEQKPESSVNLLDLRFICHNDGDFV